MYIDGNLNLDTCIGYQNRRKSLSNDFKKINQFFLFHHFFKKFEGIARYTANDFRITVVALSCSVKPTS